jgi:hypothetical protein
MRLSLFMGAATPGKMVAIGVMSTGATHDLYTSPTSFNGQINVRNFTLSFGTLPAPIYLKLIYNSSTSITSQVSFNGILWTTVQAAYNGSLTVGSVGFFVDSEGGGAPEALVDWIRVS